MNCKQGDLALVVGSQHNDGKVVTCIELLPAGSEFVHDTAGPLWRVDRPLVYSNDVLPGMTAGKCFAPDKVLRSIGGSSVLTEKTVAAVAAEDEHENA